MKKRIFILLSLIFLLACAEDPQKQILAEQFDAKKEMHLIDVYVRSNYFNDFDVFEKYGLKGKLGLQYTEAIAKMANDTVRWQRFLRKADEYRQEIKEQYPATEKTEP